jgi:L-rhamnose mutarotase
MNLSCFNKEVVGILLAVCICIFASCGPGSQNEKREVNKTNTEMKRVGMVIKLDSARINEYLTLHADSNPGVRDLLEKYNLRNFSIFLTQLDDGNYYEFGYYEYTGSNYEADMAALNAEPRNKEWLKTCDPMQIPLKGETSWKKMQQVYYNR